MKTLSTAIFFTAMTLVDSRALAELSEGRSSSAVTEESLALQNSPTVTMNVNATNKKDRMLVVNATAFGVALSGTIAVTVRANGLALSPVAVGQKCSGACSANGSFWLDLDTAELANPGLFYNRVPIQVEVTGTTTSASNGLISATAQVVKKK
jgi:hypothetical protein